MEDIFKNIQFPIVRNIQVATAVDKIKSVQPAPMNNNHVMVGSELLDRTTGYCIMSYSYDETKNEYLDEIHSFGIGWGIANEKGDIIYLSENKKEYLILKLIRGEKLEDSEYQKQKTLRKLDYEINILKNRLENAEFKKSVKDSAFNRTENEYKKLLEEWKSIIE